MVHNLLGDFNDKDNEIGISDLVNLGIYYMGDTATRRWSNLKSEFAIETQQKDYLDFSYFGAEFDTRGFETIMTHMTDAIRNPSCNKDNGFNVDVFGGDELTKAGTYTRSIQAD